MNQVLGQQIALQAANTTPSLTSPRAHRTPLTSRLAANDPTLTHLQLVQKPIYYFGDGSADIAEFLKALERNTAVTSVQLSWIFLSALPAMKRVLFMDGLGSLASLEKLVMEAIGPCEALVAALCKARNLTTLWIGALRLTSNADVAKLAAAMSRMDSLDQINISNIRLQVQGGYRVDQEGMVWFQQENETEQTTQKLDLNPLLMAVSEIPSMERIQLDLKLNPDKMERIREPTLRSLCQPPCNSLVLQSCDLDDDDISVLAEELKLSANCLKMLNLSHSNRISEFGWKIMAEMLQTNDNLTGLVTPANASLTEPAVCTPPSTATRAQMDLLLRLNEKGRKRLLSDPSIKPTDWLDFLIHEVDEIDMVYFVLRTMPSLLFLK